MTKVHVVNKILGATENKKLSIGIILDLSKAFDTVNHDILIRKLDQYGIRTESNVWATFADTDLVLALYGYDMLTWNHW